MIFYCGFIASALLYWTRQSFDRPKSFAVRFALTIFFYMVLFMFVVAYSAAGAGILSQSTVLNDYAPFICLGAAITATTVYFMARKKLEAAK
jgi:hypothetical protein